LIFTDLDGTLLDHFSYKWDGARPALKLCKDLHIPVIMVSSKTRAELDILRREMDLAFPFISENGGGIFFPREWTGKLPPGIILAENIWKLSLGTPYDQLKEGLKDIREELGWQIRGFSEMTLKEISGLTGLDSEASLLAAKREFDEPFIVLDSENVDLEALTKAAEKRGLRTSSGGRFFHLHGKIDKGEAVKEMISWYREVYTGVFSVALGDSPNDFPMLRQVDQPVLIRSQQVFPGIEEEIPGLMITQRPGPRGWNSAILKILANEKEGEGIS